MHPLRYRFIIVFYNYHWGICLLKSNNQDFTQKKYDLEERTLQYTKETIYWLKLIDPDDIELQNKCTTFIDEAIQLLKIFNAIAEKSK